MDEQENAMSSKEFEYLLRLEESFIEKLIRLGMSDEARAAAEEHLTVIRKTLGD
ncbi:MAG: hypothetical protein Q4B35_00470 [Slackia sp.]|nr:hypothetical protein [Slackia sp.]